MVKAFAARLRRIADRLDPQPEPEPEPAMVPPMASYYCPICVHWVFGAGHIHIGDYPNMSGTTTTSPRWRFTNTTN